MKPARNLTNLQKLESLHQVLHHHCDVICRNPIVPPPVRDAICALDELLDHMGHIINELSKKDESRHET